MGPARTEIEAYSAAKNSPGTRAPRFPACSSWAAQLGSKVTKFSPTFQLSEDSRPSRPSACGQLDGSCCPAKHSEVGRVRHRRGLWVRGWAGAGQWPSAHPQGTWGNGGGSTAGPQDGATSCYCACSAVPAPGLGTVGPALSSTGQVSASPSGESAQCHHFSAELIVVRLHV